MADWQGESEGEAVSEQAHNPDGGKGEPTRSELAMLRRAIAAGWPMSAEVLAEGLAAAREVANSTGANDRDRMAATKVLATMHAQNVKLLEVLDNQTRLDEGKPTSRTAVVTEQTEAAVDRIRDILAQRADRVRVGSAN